MTKPAEKIPTTPKRSAPAERKAKFAHGVRMSLRAIREAVGKTQTDVASVLACEQSEVSRIEKREDVRLSTMKKYAAALGGRCEVTFVFPTGHRLIVDEPE